jgi:hypothetical protein
MILKLGIEGVENEIILFREAGVPVAQALLEARAFRESDISIARGYYLNTVKIGYRIDATYRRAIIRHRHLFERVFLDLNPSRELCLEDGVVVEDLTLGFR